MIGRWIFLCAVAEFLGIALAIVWYGVVAVTFGEPPDLAPRIGVWLLLTAAAIPEGLVLGGLQAYGLRWFFPNLSSPRWIMATTLVGLAGWAVGTFIPLFLVGETPSAGEPSWLMLALYAAVFGALAGAAFGAAQAFVLPADTAGRIGWVVANIVGWACGLPLIFVAAQAASEFAAPLAMVALGAAGGLGAGLCVGVATAAAVLCNRPLVSVAS